MKWSFDSAVLLNKKLYDGTVPSNTKEREMREGGDGRRLQIIKILKNSQPSPDARKRRTLTLNKLSHL